MLEQNDIKTIKNIIRNELNTIGLLQGQWHLGTVDGVVDTKTLTVFIDGSDTSVTCKCNPKVTFTTGDHVFVLYVNGNSKDKFVPFHRGL